MLIRRVMIWIRVIVSLLRTFFGVKSNILNAEQTVDAICDGKSIIRFGDGEFGIFSHRNIHYQIWSDELKEAMLNIKNLAESKKVDCPYLLAVPKKYMQCTGFELCKKRVLISSWSDSRLEFKKNFNKDVLYGDAFVFERKNAYLYKKIWESSNAENIVFIHNDNSYAENFSSTYNKNVFFIKCPNKNAFESLDEICLNINNLITSQELTKENTQFVISAGPAGKVVVYKYSKLGYHCIDAGHCWDDPLNSD